MDKLEITDDMLYKSCKNIESYILEKLPNEEDLNHTFSKKFKSKMIKLIKSEKRHPIFNSIYKYSQKIAIIFLIIITGLFTVTISVEALRNQFFEVIKKAYDTFISYTVITDSSIHSDEDFKVLEPKYLPNTFKEVDRIDGFDEVFITYKNDIEEEIIYNYGKIVDGHIQVDSENVKIENVSINDINAEYMSKGDTHNLIWNDKKYFYWITFYTNSKSNHRDTKKELIKIAENIK